MGLQAEMGLQLFSPPATKQIGSATASEPLACAICFCLHPWLWWWWWLLHLLQPAQPLLQPRHLLLTSKPRRVEWWQLLKELLSGHAQHDNINLRSRGSITEQQKLCGRGHMSKCESKLVLLLQAQHSPPGPWRLPEVA